MTQSEPDAFWESAGRSGYAEAMYSSQRVAGKLNAHMAELALDTADRIGVEPGAAVLELGCGDGWFANTWLAPRYGTVTGYDKSVAAIERARAMAPSSALRFEVGDIAELEWPPGTRYDAVFLMSILHHVKQATPALIERLAAVTERVVVWEPNGNHLLRKLLELTPGYRRAGEDSFREVELVEIFRARGFQAQVQRRVNLFPTFTPEWAYRLLLPLEARIERRRSALAALCTVNLLGLVRA